VEDVLQTEFGRSLTDENVHILDPFTGTGTFIMRLLQSGIIKPEDLTRKYSHEIHANEIVLLAYYIASINIENVYHELLQTTSVHGSAKLCYSDPVLMVADSSGVDAQGALVELGAEFAPASANEQRYASFPGICLTDTFQLGETEQAEVITEASKQNSERVQAQRNTRLMVIIGNPPYSVGQKSANDNAQNLSYEKLDRRISETYAASSPAVNQNALYDTYIKAFRWSADRLDPEHGGVICFVTNASWIDGIAAAGFRCHLEQEFSDIYVFNLRGNQRTGREVSKREGGKVFGSGSRTPIAITLLVKRPNKRYNNPLIRYYESVDYLNREDKLASIARYSSIRGIEWTVISPNKHNDWVNLRSELFNSYIPIGDKEDKSAGTFFRPVYSRGLASARDHFCWSYSKTALATNIATIIDFYNDQCAAYHVAKNNDDSIVLDEFVNYDSARITWNRGFKQDLARGTRFTFRKDRVYQGLYRPFTKQHIYYAKELNDMTYQMPRLFPRLDSANLLICVSGRGGTKEPSALITDVIPDLGVLDGSQCFPLYWYEQDEPSNHQIGWLQHENAGYVRHCAITDFIHSQFRLRYGAKVTNGDIFYFVYGILHCPNYRITFAADLKKMLPRLPLLENPADFWAFSQAGRKLADLHLNYESRPAPEGVMVNGMPPGQAMFSPSQFIVKKMSFASKGKKDAITYNSHIRVSGIPLTAYDYVVNGKSAIEWVMERYAVTVHKESGIVNDANLWGAELGNPRYILDLLLSVIAVSVDTVKIVASLPEMDFGEG